MGSSDLSPNPNGLYVCVGSARDSVAAAVRLDLVGPMRAVAVQSSVMQVMEAMTASVDISAPSDAASASPLLDAAQASHGFLDMRLFHT